MIHLEKYISLSVPSWRRGLGRLIYLFNPSNSLLQGRALMLFLIVLTCSSIAQTNKKKVLVIPYGRFELESDFSLEEIAEKNNIASTEVFNAYQKSMLNVFDSAQSENFEFIAATDVILNPYKKYLKYQDGKFEGRNHYAVKMKGFPEKEFRGLMEQNDASFVVFVNWYLIKKATFTSRGKKRRRYKYSSHYVDYEIYNLFQQKVVGVGKLALDFATPTDKEAEYKALRLKEVELGYAQFVTSIVEVLNNPIKEK